MLSLAAACGDDAGGDDAVSDDTDGTSPDDTTDDTDSPSGRLDAGGNSRLDASKPSTPSDAGTDAASAKPDASAAKPDASTPKADAGADAGGSLDAGSDAGTGLPGLPDLGGLFPTDPAPDAGSTPSNPSPGTGACNDQTPHGCYTPAAGNNAGCPKQSPEIPTGYPSLDQWELCNGGAVGAGTSCSWEGPNGSTATCVCDTGVHWLCAYL